MTKIFKIFFCFFLFFSLFFIVTKQANAASTCYFSDCYAISCSPSCLYWPVNCGQTVSCTGYCPAENYWCSTTNGQCNACPRATPPPANPCNQYPYSGQCYSPGAQQYPSCNKYCSNIGQTAYGTSVSSCQYAGNGYYCWYNSGVCYANTCSPTGAGCPLTCLQTNGVNNGTKCWTGRLDCNNNCTNTALCGGNNGCVTDYASCPTPAPIVCQTGAATAVGCTVGCAWVNGRNQKCHLNNRLTNDVCSATCTAGGPWNCVEDPSCPNCTGITCGTNPNAGGTCVSGSSQNSNISGCTATCPNGQQVSGYSISVCQSNNCYYNDCTCYPNAGACNGQTKTTLTCNASGTAWDPSNVCVINGTCLTATPTPTPTPYCTTDLSCDPNKCGVQCGNGTMPCQYTGPAPCTLTNAPSQPCNKNCPNGQNCDYTKKTCQLNNTISGNVFVDTNGDGSQTNGEVNYTGTITITSSNGASVTYSGGSYTVNNLTPGTYTISYTNGPPSGYRMTYIVNGPPPSFTVSVGASSCSFGTYKNAACDANGNISNLNFGISNVKPWIQCVGGSCRIDSGWKYKVPSTAVGGAYASVPGGSSTSPGLIYSGNIDPDFTPGQASVPNWTVGGLTYPETFAPPKIGGIVKTSYNYLASRAREANITPIDIAASCGGNIGNCTLSSITHGVYIANGNLRLNSYNFTGNQNFVILVTGNLTVVGKITVQNGSTAVFSALGDITIDRSVGEAAASSAVSDIEGLYSADRNFIADGISNCATGVDLRLNVAGNIIANAGLSGGSFQNNRDLCGNDISYPSIAITQRADLILNSPDFIKQPSYTWQEAAP